MMVPARPGHNASYSVAIGFVWFRIAKSGTHSIRRLLETLVPDLRSTGWHERHPRELRRLLRSGAPTFAIVRDPWSRLVSAWLDKIADDSRRAPVGENRRQARISRLGALDEAAVHSITSDFGAFVRRLPGTHLATYDRHFVPQSTILGAIEPKMVGRFERFDLDLHKILAQLNVETRGVEVPHRNRTAASSRRLDEWYDATTQAIAAEMYAEDIRRWGYRFGEPPAAGPA